ncbi:MAG: aspartate kinase [Flavobacteriales bacterium]|nr:aspartate kinase [Flavobacteriales bacterium]MDW8431356.1 aspartate kinase [Flavobacteriales bacterium]
MKLRVFKFGGASVRDAEGIRNITKIVRNALQQGTRLACVVSATGKTTNALEHILKTWLKAPEAGLRALQELAAHHVQIARDLLKDPAPAIREIESIQERIAQGLAHPSGVLFDALYDQVVSEGERMATALVSAYWQSEALPHSLLDARQLIRTNPTWREGEVLWEPTREALRASGARLWEQNPGQVLLTQGFIGGGPHGESVTLGREGSDYSAALIAAGLEAEDVVIWKDVAGVYNADPKVHPGAVLFSRLSYDDALELACYGATIIHPKTIFPLKSSGIPLLVKSFQYPEAPGTRIDNNRTLALVPALIQKPRQALLQIRTKNGEFLNENHLATIFQCARQSRLKVNALHHTALEINLCVEDDLHHIDEFLKALAMDFSITTRRKLELITLIHPSPTLTENVLGSRKPLLEQSNHRVMRFVAEAVN